MTTETKPAGQGPARGSSISSKAFAGLALCADALVFFALLVFSAVLIAAIAIAAPLAVGLAALAGALTRNRRTTGWRTAAA